MTMFKVNSGKYRHIVTFQKKTIERNPYGENTDVWTDFLTVRVGIFPISGKELLAAMVVNGEATTRINMRYIPNVKIDSTMRVIFGERIFEIIAPPINFQESNVEMQILCKERT
jgi:SPP1 family predicted phage head-tail adaptor